MSQIILFDRSTIAIVTPTLVLWGLLAVAIHKKRLWRLQPGKIKLVRAELTVYLSSLVLSSLVLTWCLSHLSWHVVLRPDQNWFLNGSIPRVIDLLISVSLGLPLLWFGQMKVLRAATGGTIRNTLLSSQFIFTASLFSFLLLVGLPLVQWLLITCGISGESFFFMRALFLMSFVFSTIPSSIAGLAVSLHGESFPTKKFRRAAKFLDKNDLSNLEKQTDEELHCLVDVALKSSKIDVADKISQQLLRRAESY